MEPLRHFCFLFVLTLNKERGTPARKETLFRRIKLLRPQRPWAAPPRQLPEEGPPGGNGGAVLRKKIGQMFVGKRKKQNPRWPHIRVLVPGGRRAQVDGEAPRHDLIQDLFHGQEYDIFLFRPCNMQQIPLLCPCQKTDIVFVLIFSNVECTIPPQLSHLLEMSLKSSFFWWIG